MEKNSDVKYRRELRREYLKYGLLIVIWVCFLIYQIIRIMNTPTLYEGAVSRTFFSLAVLIGLIIVTGADLYRQAISYIQWYKGIFDSIPAPVIVTDKEAVWQQTNKKARESVDAIKTHGMEVLSSKHLLGADGNIMVKTWVQGATEFRVSGNPLSLDGKDAGHIILLYDISGLTNPGDAQTDLITEIKGLLGQLTDATANFEGCATSLAGYTVHQAGVIRELSDVIVEIASGTLYESDELNKRMELVKMHMQSQIDSNKHQINRMKKALGDLSGTYASINGVLQRIDSVQQPSTR